MSYIIGLTGGIATGKSNLSSALRAAGAPVVDADKISHGLTAPGGAALERIREAFGGEYVKDGVLDRKALGELVFNDPEALKTLNGITHPLIFEEMDRQIVEADRKARRWWCWTCPCCMKQASMRAVTKSGAPGSRNRCSSKG